MNNQELINAFKSVLSKYEKAELERISSDKLRINGLDTGICMCLRGLCTDYTIPYEIYYIANALIKKDVLDGNIFLFPVMHNINSGNLDEIYEKCIIPRIEYLKDKINILKG